MDILIEFKDTLHISLVEKKSKIEDYSSISLTAGNYTANPKNFNFLPNDLLQNNALKKEYEDFINHVNTAKEVGVMSQFPPSIYFFVPKTNGDEEIETLLVDLFNAISELNVEELLMTHWMYISSEQPQTEFNSLINFIQLNKNKLNIKKLYIRIDKDFLGLLFDQLSLLRDD
jgi:hypothetical protein